MCRFFFHTLDARHAGRSIYGPHLIIELVCEMLSLQGGEAAAAARSLMPVDPMSRVKVKLYETSCVCVAPMLLPPTILTPKLGPPVVLMGSYCLLLPTCSHLGDVVVGPNAASLFR